MNETPDTPDASELSDMDNSEELELASSEELDDSAEAEEENEESSDLSFALLALALLIMVGASVYFVGVLLGSDEDTAAAQERATPKSKALRHLQSCLLYTSPSPRDLSTSRMPSSA